MSNSFKKLNMKLIHLIPIYFSIDQSWVDHRAKNTILDLLSNHGFHDFIQN